LPKITGGSIAAHRQHTRERIFAALSQLMYERGYDSVTLADVAAAAGMSRTSIYNYFPDKDSLVVGYAEHETVRYVTDLRESLAEVTDPVAQLRIYIGQQLRYVATNHLPPGPALRAVLPDQAYQRVLEHVGSLEDVLRQILRDGAEQGVLPGDADDVLPLVAACINRRVGDGRDRDALEADIARTEAFVLRALGAQVDATP
jgi:AcrR family transcriptional regulator